MQLLALSCQNSSPIIESIVMSRVQSMVQSRAQVLHHPTAM